MNLSPFITWLLYSSITASVLVLIIVLVKKLGKNVLGTKGHYFIWFLIIIKLLSPYSFKSHASILNVFHAADQQLRISDSIHIEKTMAQYNKPSSNATIPQQSNTQNIQSIEPTDINTKSPDGFNIPAHISLNNIIFFIWLSGTLVFAVITLYRDIAFYFRVKRSGRIESEKLKRIISDCKKKMGIHAEVVPFLTDAIPFPSIYGIVKPKLLVPPQVVEMLSEEKLKYIVLHELSHLKRKDIVVNCLTIALKIMHWFNPIIRFAFNRMKYDMEVSCDALALSFVNQNEYTEYGQTLISLIKSIGNRPIRVTNAAGILSKKSQVKGRILMISYFKKNSYRWSAIALAIVLFVGIIGLTSPIRANTNNASVTQTNKGKILKFADPKLSESIARGNNMPLKSTIYEGDAKKLKSLYLVDVKNLQGIENCSNLKELTAEYCSFKDLSPLAKLKNLTALKIQVQYTDPNVMVNLVPLKELKSLKSLSLNGPKTIDSKLVFGLNQLEKLELYNCRVKDISQITNLKNLNTLYLYNCNITDLSFLKDMKKIRELSVVKNNLTDISAVSWLTGLKILNITDNSISNIDVLSKMKQLEKLEISRNTLTDLKPLAELENLEVLVASVDHISDLSPLSNLKKLKFLELGGNNIRDISPISDLHLEALVLSSNPVDIKPLKNMESLRELYLSNNGITDISPLQPLTNLTALFLIDNKITDLAPITKLTNIQCLDLMNNNITDIKPLADMKNLNILHLKGNQIKDFSPIVSFSNNIQYKDF